MERAISRRARGLRRVLFLCPEDYRFGRFCEEYFNSIARNDGLNWLARSRAIVPVSSRERFMDPQALTALRRRGAAPVNHERSPASVTLRAIAISDVLIGVAFSAARQEQTREFIPRCRELWEPCALSDASTAWRYLSDNAVELLNVLERRWPVQRG